VVCSSVGVHDGTHGMDMLDVGMLDVGVCNMYMRDMDVLV
jgi:hypothetical protein